MIIKLKVKVFILMLCYLINALKKRKKFIYLLFKKFQESV